MKIRRARRRGYLLVLVIAMGTLMFLAGIAATSISSQDALAQRHLETTLHSHCAADVGIAEAVGRLVEDSRWKGTLDNDVQGGGEYALDFAQGNALNNMHGAETAEANGREVPVGTAYLKSDGKCDGLRTESGAIVSVGGVMFDDTFSTPASGWESNHPNLTVYLLGKWVLDLKLLSQTYLMKGDESWRNYTYECTVLLSQVSDMGFVVRATGEPARMTGYVVGYNLLDHTLLGGTFYLNRIENGRFVERIQTKRGNTMGLGGLLWLLNLYHTYKITVKDGTIVATVDGKEIINATIEDNPIKAGRVGLLPGLLSTMLIDRATVRTLPEVRSRWRTL